MKLFKKLMAGVMAIAMLSAYTVAFAGSATSGITASGSSSVEFQGDIAGSGGSVFLMKLPTAAANASLSFTVDPKEIIKSSPPTNAITTGSGASDYGTVVFSIASGTQATYTNKSEPLKVVSMSSDNVTVNMIATLSDTKMKLSTTSGFTGDDAKNHLYLGVQVANISAVSGSAAAATPVVSGGLQCIDALGATDASVLEAVPTNFTTMTTSGGYATVVSGSTAATSAANMTAASAFEEKNWNAVQYTVEGYSNPNADWQIEGLAAPTLTIKWDVVSSRDVTYPFSAPTDTTYTAKLDKAAYKADETVTLYIKPTATTAKVKAVKFTYISLKDGDGTMDRETTVSTTIAEQTVNGAYVATFQLPTNMSKDGSPAGSITTWSAPRWEVTLS